MRTLRAAGVAVLICLVLEALTLAQDAPSSPVPDLVNQRGPVRVTGTYLPRGFDCGPGTLCRYEGAAMMSDARLTGCYVVTPSGGTTEGSWGRLTVQAQICDGWGLPIPDDPVTWLGEWFGTGKPPTQSESDVGAPYPLEASWLHGMGGNEGLDAIVRFLRPRENEWEGWDVEGWIFPSPTGD